MSYFVSPQQMAENAKNIGTNVFNAFQEQEQRNTISSILENAKTSNDPNFIQNAIAEILAKVKPEYQQQLLQAVDIMQKQRQFDLTQQAARDAGFDPNLAPHLQTIKSKRELEASKPDKPEKPALTLNEALNQAAKVSATKIHDIMEPITILDPLSKMRIFIDKLPTGLKEKTLRKKTKEINRQFKAQKELYKRYGQPVPANLKELIEEQISGEYKNVETSPALNKAMSIINSKGL